MKIGSLKLNNLVVLAPMAGVTDSSFRKLAVEMGCALVFTEMVSAKGVIYSPRQSLDIAHFDEEERPVGIQLFGSDPAAMAEATALVGRENPDVIDINMGCPVRKVVAKGEGCALMKNPALAHDVARAVCRATSLPVTVKIRKGWDVSSVNAEEVALAVQDAGVAAVSVHGRTRCQGYSGQADWGIIQRVKEVLRIPVIGNGDIFSPEDAARMLTETACDAVMLGRGTLGNPWLIRRTAHYLRTGELLPPPEVAERVAVALRHLEMVVEKKGELTGVREMRKHLSWYTKGLRGAARIREQLMSAKTINEVMAALIFLEKD